MLTSTRVSTQPTAVGHVPLRRGRVLQVVDADDVGVGTHVIDLARHLGGDGWTIDVAYVPSGVAEDFADLLAGLDDDVKEVLRLEPGRGFRPARARTISQLRRFVRRHVPDVIHGHGLRGGAWAQLAATGSPARVVHTPNALEGHLPDLAPTRRSLYRNLEAGLSPLTDHLIHSSQAEADHAQRLGLLPVSGTLIEPDPTPPRRRSDDVRFTSRRIASEVARIYMRLMAQTP